jgi:hypothetical protein
MKQDSIIEEIHEFRRQHAKKFNYDVRSMFDDLKNDEKKVKHKLVSRPPRRLQGATQR